MTTPHLRDLDWRFLLPGSGDRPFESLVLLGGTPTLAALAREQGVAARVITRPEQAADAVVVLHGAHTGLEEAARLLRPGGALYYEVRRRSRLDPARSPRATLRQAREVGLTPAGFYWVSPDFAHRHMYLPLDTAHALGWYLRTFYAASTAAQRVAEPVLLALARSGFAARSLLPTCYALTAVRQPHPEGAASIFTRLDVAAKLKDGNVRPLVFTAGDDLNRVVIFPFTTAARVPREVIKLGRSPERSRVNSDEQRALHAIRERLEDGLRASIPAPLGTVSWGTLTAGIETCAPGRLLSAYTARRGLPLARKVLYLRLAAGWLARFNRAAQVRTGTWSSRDIAEWLDEPVVLYKRAFGATASEERLFARARAWAASLEGLPMPVVWLHWGFTDRNLFVQGDRITVIDWEGASPGPPLFDLLYFVTHWCFAVRGAQGRAAQLRAFRELVVEPSPDDPVTRAVFQAVEEYMAGLDLDPRFLPLMLVTMWVARALGKVKRQAATHDAAQSEARAGNAYVQYVALLAEHTDRLFPAGANETAH